MAQELNATCDICGKKYHICSSCKEVKSFTPWRTVTDTMQHYLIFLALSEYTKTKDKEKAKEELSKCDLSELDTFNENIKAVIKEIMAEEIVYLDSVALLKLCNAALQERKTVNLFVSAAEDLSVAFPRAQKITFPSTMV